MDVVGPGVPVTNASVKRMDCFAQNFVNAVKGKNYATMLLLTPKLTLTMKRTVMMMMMMFNTAMKVANLQQVHVVPFYMVKTAFVGHAVARCV